MSEATYELYYWPGIQGRGEFVRLALEEAGVSYVDVAREPEQGVPVMMKRMKEAQGGPAPFAPPFLRVGEVLIAQTANILAFLGARHGLAPADEAGRAHALQLQLTVADLVSEVHETHHPIASALYYEDQREEARRRAAAFLKDRLPKFLGYFERTLGEKEWMLGRLSYVDLSVFQVLCGLEYSFPRAMAREAQATPRLRALRDRVAARPRIRAYLDSERRIPFNESGIFRRYPELDG